MADFLWKKVSEKEKEDIRRQAKKIMDDFSEKISKVDRKVGESLIERAEGERIEVDNEKTSCSKIDREIMFSNALNKNKDFIIAEKKRW